MKTILSLCFVTLMVVLTQTTPAEAGGVSSCSSIGYSCNGVYYPGCSVTCYSPTWARCTQGQCYNSGFGYSVSSGSNFCQCY